MDEFAHSHYFFIRFGQVELQLWPPTWPVFVTSVLPIAAALVIVVLISRLSYLKRE